MSAAGAQPPALTPAMTRAQARRLLARAFDAAGLATPALDARVLLCEALAITTTELATRPEKALGESAAQLAAFAARRLGGEPVARIRGMQEFWGMPFLLSPATLVPRPETETLVETALAAVAGRPAPRILDLGTGTGCILVALLSELPQARGVGVDRSPQAAATARRNAQANGVGDRALFVVGDWARPLAGRFDLVVSNPPYIETATVGELAPEVRLHDPQLALDGGPDGLAAYRRITAEVTPLLTPSASLVLEVGAGQAPQVCALMGQMGLVNSCVAHDLSGIERVVCATSL
ncbi:peptide chain release factor N(5)-glutamine methyltransferase [Chelatococcus sp. GCM10030263]|uniref:peptide chain release factor N(5)-glutamine methyltransferase n=1 Tax=Chelatococcus sp. GCM10030263 TaxID=3273387 RepID=UPI00361918AF